MQTESRRFQRFKQSLSDLKSEQQLLSRITLTVHDKIRDRGLEKLQNNETSENDFIQMNRLMESANLCFSGVIDKFKDWANENGVSLDFSQLCTSSLDSSLNSEMESIKRTAPQTETIRHPPDDLELSKNEANCDQSNKHGRFIDPENFGLDDLPNGYKDPDIKKGAVGMALRTGRLRVAYVSKNRPRKFDDRNAPYPFNDLNGHHFVRYGTGFILDVKKDDGRMILIIKTATHLVLEGTEVAYTDFTLKVSGGSVIFPGMEIVGSPCRLETDRSILKCKVDDNIKALELKMLVEANDAILHQICQKYDKGAGGPAVMICNPHGSEKAKIVLGVTKGWNSRTIDGDKYAQLRFSSPVCPGCSGAIVWTPGYKAPNKKFFMDGLPYSGTHGEDQLTVWGPLDSMECPIS